MTGTDIHLIAQSVVILALLIYLARQVRRTGWSELLRSLGWLLRKDNDSG